MPVRTFDPLPQGAPRDRWTATLESLLAGAGVRPTVVASALAAALGQKATPDLKPWFTGFKNGEPAQMKRIFGAHADAAKLMPALCKVLGLTEGDLLAHLEQARNGDAIGLKSPHWHLDFPSIGAGEVCVEPWVLQHPAPQPVALHVLAGHVAEKLRRDDHATVRLYGQVGSGRHTAATLLCEMAELLVALGDAGKRSNMGELPAPPLTTQVVDVAPAGRAGARTLTVVVNNLAGNESHSAAVQPWTAGQVAEIAEQLADRTETTPLHAERFREFARAAGHDREVLGSDDRVVAIIGQLAAAGRDGVPQDRRQARLRTVTSAWQRGTLRLRPADPLTRVDHSVWTAFWARRVASTKSPEWTTLTTAEATACARDASRALRVFADAGLAPLLDTLAGATGKSKQTARGAIDGYLAASDPEVLLQRFCDMDLLVRCDAEFRATDIALACTAAAWGLAPWHAAELAAALAHSEHNFRLARELGCVGVPMKAFARMISAWPAHLHVEASRARIVHAAGLQDTKAHTAELPTLVPCWAAAVLADHVRALDWRVLVGAGGLRKDSDLLLTAAMRDLSVRAAGVWPDLDRGSELATLKKLATPGDLQIINAWTGVCAAVAAKRARGGDRFIGAAASLEEGGLSDFEHWQSLMFLAPGQTLPWHIDDQAIAQAHAFQHRNDTAWLNALRRRADLPGDPAGPWLAGEHLVPRTPSNWYGTTPEFDDQNANSIVWQSVPGSMRLRALAIRGRGLPAERSLAIHAVAAMAGKLDFKMAPIPPEAWPDWLHLLRLQDREHMAGELIARLVPGAGGEWLNALQVDDALRIACELQLTSVLDAVMALPGQWLEQTRAVLWAGEVQIVGPVDSSWIQNSNFGIPTLQVTAASPDLWADLRRLEHLAHRAVHTWAQHGHPELLRTRWKRGPAWSVPEALRADFALIHLVSDASAAALQHVEVAEVDLEAARAWLDGLAVAVSSNDIRERYSSSYRGRPLPEESFLQLAALGRDSQALAAATGQAKSHPHTWLFNVMERKTERSWQQAVFAAADSVSPGRRLGCILLQALALWTRRENVAPILPWIEQVGKAPHEHQMWGIAFKVRPYSAVQGLDDLVNDMREMAFEALMELQDPAPVQTWLEDRTTWWGDSRAMERRLGDDVDLLTRAVRLTEPRSSARRTLLHMAATRRPPPDWFAQEALAEDRDVVASLARKLERWPQATALWRHLAATAPDVASRTNALAALRELEPACPEWPDHVAAWLAGAELPFDGTARGQKGFHAGGGFLDLLESARDMSSTKEIAQHWPTAVPRLLDQLPAARRKAQEELAQASIAMTVGGDDGNGLDSFARRSALWDAEGQIGDLETAGTILLRALSELGDMARLNRYIEPFVEALQRGEEAADVPPDLVLDWIERLRPESVAAFVRDTGPLGDWIRRYFSGSSWPRLCGATADLWESRLTAAIEKAEDPDRFGITTALGWLSHIAPDRLNRATEMLLERLPEPWTVGVIWGECLHRDDDIGLAIRNRCLMAMTNANEKPLAK